MHKTFINQQVLENQPFNDRRYPSNLIPQAKIQSKEVRNSLNSFLLFLIKIYQNRLLSEITSTYNFRLEKENIIIFRKNIMTYSILKNIVFLIIIPLLNCSTQLDGLIVNSLTLANINQSQSQIYIHKFENSFEEQPELALTLIGFECSQQTTNTSFHIIPQTIKAQGFILLWKMSIQKWNKIQLSYMASVRNDILLGCAHASIPQSYNKNQKELTLTTFPIPKFGSSIFRTFLIGCDVSNQSIKCGIFPKSLTNTSITVLIEHSGLQNATISFSFIIFSPSSSSFTSYGGFISKENFNGYFVLDLHKSIGYTPYRFHGLSYLQSGNLNSMKSVINDQFIFGFAVDTIIDKFAIFYIIIGKSSKALCLNQSLPYQFGDQCIALCPNNAYLYQYADGGIACKTCSKLLNLTLVNNTCAPINGNEQLVVLNQDQIKQRLQQQPSQIPSLVSCQDNQFILNNRCVCKIGYARIEGKCYLNIFHEPEVFPVIVQSIHVMRNISNLYSGELKNDITNTSITNATNATNTNTTNTTLTVTNSTNSTISNSNTTNTTTNTNNPSNTNSTNNTNSNSTNNTTLNNTNITNSTISTAINNTNSTSNASSQNITNSTNTTQNDTKITSNLQLASQIKANSNQIFLTLDTTDPFDFSDQSQMWRFLKAKFDGCQSPTYYCSQQKIKKNLFDCLFIFPSGIPNKTFKVNFSYAFQSKVGNLSTEIDTLKILMNSRKTNSKQMKSSNTI